MSEPSRRLTVIQTVALSLVLAVCIPQSALAEPATSRLAVDASLRRGVAWLVAQQHPDGVWRSATYGQFRDGVAVTALAAAALAHSTDKPSAARAIEFLIGNLDASGFVRATNGAAEYPTYSTALSLIAIERLARADVNIQVSPQCIDHMRDYLIAAQATAPADGAGGWGLVGGDPTDASSFRTPNVSTTRFALEALRPVANQHPETFRRAQQFLDCRQNDDGGFAFIGDLHDPLNKAGSTKDTDPALAPRIRSYGSATADGFLAQLAAGRSLDSPHVASTLGWLNSHPRVDRLPGFPPDAASASAPEAVEGLFFYYAAALAHAMAAAPDAPLATRAPALAEVLVDRQRPDGSWENTISSMREDDPLVATALASEALATLQSIPPTSSNQP